MGRTPSGITWLDEEDYVGSEIFFEQPNHSTWKLEKKVTENEYYETEQEVTSGCAFSEARAVFFCSTQDEGLPREAVIKIRMQIPWRTTATKSAHVRAKQAEATPTSGTQREIETLQCLTRADCSFAPGLYDWKQEQQDLNMWVPGGHIVYILMEKLPGIPLRDFFSDLTREERDLCRSSFKQAWLECMAAGIVNIDTGSRNLIWNQKKKKCYIIDFEHCRKTSKKDAWRDSLYISWNLARRFGGDLDDMSLWEF